MIARQEYEELDNPKQTTRGPDFMHTLDVALERIRVNQKTEPERVEQFFKDLMENDEQKYSKAVNNAVDANERDEWQKKVELATSGLV
ncbi:hypothetical protein RSOL_267750, partial [Rhizoctonia solani AG-3 Rhs1AP]